MSMQTIEPTRPDQLRRSGPPVADRTGHELGSKCEHHKVCGFDRPARHEECPGWWPAAIGPVGGFTCRCDCHEVHNHWPGWDHAVAAGHRRAVDGLPPQPVILDDAGFGNPFNGNPFSTR